MLLYMYENLHKSVIWYLLRSVALAMITVFAGV